jgi:hypothetical protein
MTEFFVLITLQMPTHNGFSTTTANVTVTMAPGATRADLYKAARDWIAEQKPEWATASVLCFVGEPNQFATEVPS